jgi:hypothetical protein
MEYLGTDRRMLLKYILQRQVVGQGMDSISSECGVKAGPCAHSNESSSSIKG